VVSQVDRGGEMSTEFPQGSFLTEKSKIVSKWEVSCDLGLGVLSQGETGRRFRKRGKGEKEGLRMTPDRGPSCWALPGQERAMGGVRLQNL